MRPVAAGLRRILASRAAIAGGILAGWCALSLIWTPFPGPAGERLLNFAATVGLTIAGYVALPERMRSANLYLLPLGVGLAGLGGAMLGPFGGAILPAGFDDDSALERAAMLIALLLWPAVAWLRSRHRNAGALAVAVAAALALVLAPRTIPLLSLAAGAAAYALATWDLRRGVRVVAGLAAGLVALGPALPFLLRPLLAPLLGAADPTVQSLKVWMRIVTGEPLRLVTGHGFETALRGRMVGLLPANAPSSLLFEIWYELGVVGAFAAAFLLWGAIRQSGRDHPVLTPGAIGNRGDGLRLGLPRHRHHHGVVGDQRRARGAGLHRGRAGAVPHRAPEGERAADPQGPVTPSPGRPSTGTCGAASHGMWPARRGSGMTSTARA